DVGGVEIAAIDDQGRIANATRQIACDLVASAGVWQPAVHLHSHTGAKPVYDDTLSAFVPGPSRQAEASAGASAGRFALADCLGDGFKSGAAAANATGFGSGTAPTVPACDDGGSAEPSKALWSVPRPSGVRGKAFVDIQDDVTDKDIALAHREGYVSVEHLKRYTTLGMGTDQGKTSNLAGHAIMAQLRGEPMQQVGTTTFRPPYTPVAFAVFSGRDLGRHYQPIRRTPTHDWQQANGATFIEAGHWLRAQVYIRQGETMTTAINREVKAVRGNVGICDVSTLGKIDVQGPDAAKFLDRVYCNTFSTLPVGRARYGLMLREDGMVMDDGTTSRLSESRFFMTTTTANAGKVMTHLEFCLGVLWPDLKVQVTSVTEQWAGIAIAGPKSRELLQRVITGIDLGNEAMPFMGVRDCQLAGIPARLFRISFSGELAYEVAVPSDYGIAAWEALLVAGKPLDVTTYGLEAMGVMRIEKGHVVGSELDGRTTAGDLGMERMLAKKKDFIGKQLLQRPGLQDPKRKRLVGLVPVDGRTRIRAGSQIIADPNHATPIPMLGHVTSACFSATLNHPIAMALVSGGPERKGETLYAAFPLRNEMVAVKVVDHVFYDPKGERLHG
ncbi:MAG: sarcosine oxidase subunit alpha, partial [Rhodospirillales bacterium]|nr:sarcosine oxidase subunit alpha [Rhodospirillales bacterium]